MTEADWKDSLRGDPAVRDNPDEVLGRQRLKHRHKELDRVLVLAELLLEQEELVVEIVVTVHFLVPLEVRGEGELHSEGGPGYRLDVAEAQTLVSQLSPAAVKDNLKERSDQPPGGLGDVHHVGNQCEPLQLELGDLRLQEDVPLAISSSMLSLIGIWGPSQAASGARASPRPST